jgi:hypothetical protein
VRRPIWGWTNEHAAVAFLFTAGLVASLAGLIDGDWVPVAVAVAALLAGLVSLGLDEWGRRVDDGRRAGGRSPWRLRVD